MKYLVLLALFSCAQLNPQPKPFKIKPEAIAFQECVERFLKIGVNPKDAVEICKESHTKKEAKMTYEEIKAADKAVVRFTAAWCGPCKSLAPIFDEVAKENPDVTVFVVDCDIHGDIAQKFGIKGIPTMMRIENGTVKLQMSGAQPKPEVEKFFK